MRGPVKPPAKILIADDDFAVRQLIIKVLADWNSEVIEADDGRQALDLALRHLPGLVVLDNHMPFRRGPDVAKEIRKDARLRSCAIVVVSSEPEKTAGQDEEPHPYDRWILKPFSIRAFKEDLERLIEKRIKT